MSIKIGFLDSSGNGLKTFSDSVKIDVNDNSFVGTSRGGMADLFSTERSAKAEFTIEVDAVTQADFGNTLNKVMNNRQYPHKIYIHEPAAASQRINMNDTGGNEAKQQQTDDPEGAYASGTEFTGTNYTHIQDWVNDVSYSTSTKDYIHYFFQFDLSTWIAAYGEEYLRRLTLFMQDPRVERGTPADDFGYVVYAYNYGNSTWIEIKRQSITVDATNQQYASLRPIEGFTDFSDFIDGSDYCQFKITNMQPRTTGGSTATLTHKIKRVELIVNGIAFKQVNPQNLNWRSAFTGDGYTGVYNLLEL
jgi:hypothetical protein